LRNAPFSPDAVHYGGRRSAGASIQPPPAPPSSFGPSTPRVALVHLRLPLIVGRESYATAAASRWNSVRSCHARAARRREHHGCFVHAAAQKTAGRRAEALARECRNGPLRRAGRPGRVCGRMGPSTSGPRRPADRAANSAPEPAGPRCRRLSRDSAPTMASKAAFSTPSMGSARPTTPSQSRKPRAGSPSRECSSAGLRAVTRSSGAVSPAMASLLSISHPSKARGGSDHRIRRRPPLHRLVGKAPATAISSTLPISRSVPESAPPLNRPSPHGRLRRRRPVARPTQG